MILSFGALAGSAAARTPAAPVLPSDADVRQMLVTRVDVQKQATGVVVGIVAPSGRRLIAYGTTALDGGRAVDGNTVFDIGSITKVFTALLLADMAQRGEVALDDPAAKYLPTDVRMPVRSGRQITLVDLATHTSGLPLRPTNLVSTNPDDKYAGYTAALLYQFLSSYPLTRDIGSRYEYSNVGYGVLGHVLSRRVGRSYGGLVQRRITRPLGMRDTGIHWSTGSKRRLAVGYDSDLAPAPRWGMGALQSAGALHSSADDLLNLLDAVLGYRKSTLSPALATMAATRRPGGMDPSTQIALAWNVYQTDGREIFWKNGSVGGYRSFIGYDAKARIGVLALANAQTAVGVDDIGLHLLDPNLPVDLHVPKVHKQVVISPVILGRYVGRYRFSPTDILTVTREGDRLFGQEPGQDKFELFAEGEHDFFLKTIDAQVTFESSGAASAKIATWHQDGQTQRGDRIE